MKTVNVGLIGYGLSGRIFHGAIISSIEGFHIKSILTNNPNRFKQVRKDLPNATVVSHLDDILNDDTIDLVVISTPNTSHYELAEKALKAGKNIIVEKPFTITTHDALRLMDLEHDTKKFISVYQNRRFDGDFLTVKNLIKEEKLGRLVEVESHFDRFRNSFKDNAWREKDIPGSGVLYDLAPHLIDQALNLFGLPQEVYADISKQRRGPVDDHFEIILYYTELKVTLKAGMLVKEETPRFKLYGTEGTFVKYGLDVQEQQLKDDLRPGDDTYGEDSEEQYGILNTTERTQIQTEIGDYRIYYRNIYNVITNDEKLIITSKDGFNVMRIIEAAFHSNQLHKRIPFKH